MTKDEIFKLAEKAGFGCCWEDIDLNCGIIWWSDECPLDEELLRFAALVAAAEREALASQTVLSDCSDSHQPDAWRTDARNDLGLPVFFCASEVKQAGPGLIPLYTTPPQRKPLTDGEIDALSRTMVKGNQSVNWLCRAIERAHGIGGEE